MNRAIAILYKQYRTLTVVISKSKQVYFNQKYIRQGLKPSVYFKIKPLVCERALLFCLYFLATELWKWTKYMLTTICCQWNHFTLFKHRYITCIVLWEKIRFEKSLFRFIFFHFVIMISLLINFYDLKCHNLLKTLYFCLSGIIFKKQCQ